MRNDIKLIVCVVVLLNVAPNQLQIGSRLVMARNIPTTDNTAYDFTTESKRVAQSSPLTTPYVERKQTNKQNNINHQQQQQKKHEFDEQRQNQQQEKQISTLIPSAPKIPHHVQKAPSSYAASTNDAKQIEKNEQKSDSELNNSNSTISLLNLLTTTQTIRSSTDSVRTTITKSNNNSHWEEIQNKMDELSSDVEENGYKKHDNETLSTYSTIYNKNNKTNGNDSLEAIIYDEKEFTEREELQDEIINLLLSFPQRFGYEESTTISPLEDTNSSSSTFSSKTNNEHDVITETESSGLKTSTEDTRTETEVVNIDNRDDVSSSVLDGIFNYNNNDNDNNGVDTPSNDLDGIFNYNNDNNDNGGDKESGKLRKRQLASWQYRGSGSKIYKHGFRFNGGNLFGNNHGNHDYSDDDDDDDDEDIRSYHGQYSIPNSWKEDLAKLSTDQMKNIVDLIIEALQNVTSDGNVVIGRITITITKISTLRISDICCDL